MRRLFLAFLNRIDPLIPTPLLTLVGFYGERLFSCLLIYRLISPCGFSPLPQVPIPLLFSRYPTPPASYFLLLLSSPLLSPFYSSDAFVSCQFLPPMPPAFFPLSNAFCSFPSFHHIFRGLRPCSSLAYAPPLTCVIFPHMFFVDTEFSHHVPDPLAFLFLISFRCCSQVFPAPSFFFRPPKRRPCFLPSFPFLNALCSRVRPPLCF